MKQHKFFERYLDNDLDELFNYLDKKYDEMIKDISKYSKDDYIGAPSQLMNKYNVFDFNNISINKLEDAVKGMVIEACEYYEIDFDQQNYRIHGWFNQNKKIQTTSFISPVKNNKYFHDHMGGQGAPQFHGFYSVNAEPSITYYLINNKDLLENHNINNRAIVSATGHPHGRDDWFEDKPRITLAYDIIPLTNLEIIGKENSKVWRPFK